ncbi:hypothetical protein B0H13DRAFT_1048570 [Mycena leptocephala]|nr:hypothetical protein B0H13DRAFT_1048570 [Mycena leptocephala]
MDRRGAEREMAQMDAGLSLPLDNYSAALRVIIASVSLPSSPLPSHTSPSRFSTQNHANKRHQHAQITSSPKSTSPPSRSASPAAPRRNARVRHAPRVREWQVRVCGGKAVDTPLRVYPGLKINFISPAFLRALRSFAPHVIHLVDPIWLGV